MGQVTTTQSDGTYHLSGLCSAKYLVGLDQETKFLNSTVPPPHVLANVQQVAPAANQTTQVPDLRLTTGGLLHVHIEDKNTQTLLPNVFVYAWSQKSPPSQSAPSMMTSTNTKGECLLRLPEGQSSVSIGGRFLKGANVIYDKGRPYAINRGAEISLDGEAPQPFRGLTKVEVIKGRIRELALRFQPYIAPTPTPIPRRLLPPPGKATLTGQVVDESGRPVGGIPVLALIQQKARWEIMKGASLDYSNGTTPNLQKKWASIEGVLRQSTTTNSDGIFTLEGLTSAPYNLVIASPGTFGLEPPKDSVAPSVEGVWAKEGHVIRRSNPIVLSHGSLITGRIVDKMTGLPLGGINIGSNGPQLPSSNDNIMGTQTDELGRFSLRVASGTTSLYIAGPWNNDTNFIFGDSRASAENVARIRTSRGLFAGSGDVQFEIDGGTSPPEKGHADHNLEVTLQKGEVRRLTLHLRRLVPKPQT